MEGSKGIRSLWLEFRCFARGGGGWGWLLERCGGPWCITLPS